jgi:hypothetical protein
MDDIALYDSLVDCLLTEDEMADGPEHWATLQDPFPKWNRSLEDLLANYNH